VKNCDLPGQPAIYFTELGFFPYIPTELSAEQKPMVKGPRGGNQRFVHVKILTIKNTTKNKRE